MSVEVPVLELYSLADVLRGGALPAHEAAGRLVGTGDLGEIEPAARHLLECFTLAARGLAAEVDLLARTVEAVAGSWLALDENLLAHRAQVRAR